VRKLHNAMMKELMTRRLEEALRWAAECHAGQVRRDSETPYFVHAAAVALVLQRAGFEDDVVIAGLLHDVVEDSSATVDEVAARFGSEVAETVRHCSEIKHDAIGKTRPWIDRKRDHLEALRQAPLSARAVVLADKLHNLNSIEFDLSRGRSVWSQFHASRADVLWYYRTAIETCGADDARLALLSAANRCVLERIERLE
jgi:guanosine-3',5'-bis(diphosphate) 3'-pyrophosphohydrolase